MRKAIQRVNTVLHLKSLLHRPRTAAVILAGGSGRRVQSDTPKQYLCVLGTPILIHSALAFQKCSCIDEIVIVTRKEYKVSTEILCRRYGIKKLRAVVVGGDTRQESAEKGFAAISDKAIYVALHDAARCLITPRQIKEVAIAAYAYRAASASAPVTDTIKVMNRYGMIEKNLPREELRAAQTPQIFHRVYYKAALDMAKEQEVAVTDDNSLMELLGQRVKLVDTGEENFKITFASDIARAEAVLRRREEQRGK